LAGFGRAIGFFERPANVLDYEAWACFFIIFP